MSGTVPSPTLFHIEVQKPSRTAGHCSVVNHRGSAESRQDARIAVNAHLNIAMLEGLESELPGFELCEMLRLGENLSTRIRKDQII